MNHDELRIVTDLPHRVRVIENTWIPMPDGVHLAARMWIPEKAQREPVPAILEYIPYRKRDLTRARDDVNHSYLAGHGYASVRVDLRGSGDSEGVLRDQFLEQERYDGVEVVEWLAAQPWCDGNVGMFGISWGGFSALQVAALQPAALGAIVAVCATDDLYVENMHYMGGCLLGDNLSEATTMFAYNACPPDPAIAGKAWRDMWLERLEGSGLWLETWLQHQWRDGYWKPGSVREDYSAITCPVFAVSGWADGYTNAVLRLLENLEVPRRGLIGPWSHTYPHMGIPGPAIGFLQETLRWFDYWLKNRDTGIGRDPMLRVWMQDGVPPRTHYEHRPGRWIAEDQWPSANIEPCVASLGDHSLHLDAEPPYEAPSLRVRSPLSVGLFAGKWCSYAAPPDLPGDQREEDGGALVFESDAIETPVEIFGRPELVLEVSVDRPVAMVAARLSDVVPDGRATRVTYGLLNLTHRDGHAHPEPLEPGHRYAVTLRLNGCAHSFGPGHRVRVSLSTSYWPLAWPPPEPVTLTVHTANSWLVLPTRLPRDDDQRLRAFDRPEGGRPVREELVAPSRASWRVIRDLGNDESILEVVRHESRFFIDEIGTEVVRRTREYYRSIADDFESIRGETNSVRAFHRDGWHPRSETKIILTADSDSFYLHARLDAYEGERRIYSQNWDRTIARKLV